MSSSAVLTAAIGIMSAALPGQVHAGPCDIVAGTAATVAPPTGVYDVFSTSNAESVFQIRIENTTGAQQQCRIFFDQPGNNNGNARINIPGLPGNADRLFFDVTRNNGNTQDLIIPANANRKQPRLTNNIAAGSTINRNVRMVMGDGQFVPPGSYQRSIRVATYQGNANNPTILSQQIITVQATVEPQGAIFVSVVGPATTSSGKTAFVDFGSITASEAPVNVNFLVQSNGNYRYRVSSDNGGQLQLLNPPAATGTFDDFIEYTVEIGGNTVPTDGVTQFPAGAPFSSTDSTGTQQVFSIDLEDGAASRPDVIEGKLAGRYEDILTFTILPE